MFKYIVKLVLPITFTTLITGCSVANLDSTYNKEEKSTYLDLGTNKTYIIPNSSKEISQKGYKSINSASPIIDIYTSNGICSNFSITKLPPLGRNAYYTTQAKYDIYQRYGKSRCSTQEISGLEFHDCTYKYVISYDSNNEEGFLTEKRYFLTENEQCFEDIKRFVKGTETEIETKRKSYVDQSYSGIFSTTTPLKKHCIKEGNFEAKIINKQLQGSLFYKDKDFRNKKISFDINVDKNNKFKYDFQKDNIKIEGNITSDKQFIDGIYKKNDCTGVLEAKRY